MSHNMASQVQSGPLTIATRSEGGHLRTVPKLLIALVTLALVLLLFPPKGSAIPAFSRQYATSCMTCHIDFPKLNDFGKAFKDGGFKFPKDDESRHDIQAASATGPRDHTSLNFGSFYLYGKSLQQFIGADAVLRVEEPYYRAGGDFNFNYRRFNIYGVYMYGHDQNLLPVDENGTLIPLPLSTDSPLPVRFVKSVPARFNGGFVQADFMVHPW